MRSSELLTLPRNNQQEQLRAETHHRPISGVCHATSLV